jgi:hypothetical protein
MRGATTSMADRGDGDPWRSDPMIFFSLAVGDARFMGWVIGCRSPPSPCRKVPVDPMAQVVFL